MKQLTVRILRSDIGTRFEKIVLNNFCTSKSSKTIFSTRNFVLNGVVQRKIHTLVEATWITFSESMLSKYTWAEEVDSVCFMQDRTLISIEHEKTPDEFMANRSKH